MPLFCEHQYRIAHRALARGVCWRIHDRVIDHHGGRAAAIEVHGIVGTQVGHESAQLFDRKPDARIRPVSVYRYE